MMTSATTAAATSMTAAKLLMLMQLAMLADVQRVVWIDGGRQSANTRDGRTGAMSGALLARGDS